MPRTLPWLAHPDVKPKTKQTSSSSPAPKRKRALEPDSNDDLVNSDLESIAPAKPRRPKPKARGRSPSTSPPPAPPSIEYMHEGYAADDLWMMVEDEFHSIAQTFTKHIHHAEYVRLKKLAKSRGEDTIRGITRPTDGRTAQSNATKLKLEAEAKAKQIKNGLNGMNAPAKDDSEEEDEYMFDPQLAGLMTGSQRASQDLKGLAKARSNTRAAAGFTRSPQKPRSKYEKPATSNGKASSSKQPVPQSEESEDEDDLDRPIRSRQTSQPKISTSRQPQRSRSEREALAAKAANNAAPGFFKRFAGTSEEGNQRRTASDPQPSAASTASKQPTSSRVKPTSATTEAIDSASPEKPIQQSQATLDYRAKRQARLAAQQKRKDEDTEKAAKPKSTIDVPTFAI